MAQFYIKDNEYASIGYNSLMLDRDTYGVVLLKGQ